VYDIEYVLRESSTDANFESISTDSFFICDCMTRIYLASFLIIASGCGGSGACTVNSDCHPGLFCVYVSENGSGYVRGSGEGQCIAKPEISTTSDELR
jgi:hypothetical protein